MSAAPSRSMVLSLYRSLLRESSKFHDYNFRSYALRRTKEEFHAHRQETDAVQLTKLYEEGQRNLGIVRRQVTINQMYQAKPVIIDQKLMKQQQQQQQH